MSQLMKKQGLLAAAAAMLLWAFAASAAIAQSSPNFSYGQVPTAGQWNAAFASKQDVLRFVPLNQAGGTMTGPLRTAPSTINVAGFSVLPGIAPTAPANGDIWSTTAGFYGRINGQTIQFSAGIPSGTISSNLTGAPAQPTGNTLSTILDAGIGSARGTLAVRNSAGWVALPLGASGYTVQSNGTDAIYAPPSPGIGSVRYDANQGLTSAQQDQARINIGGAVPTAPLASATLATTDIERPLTPTGSITLTVPNGGAGWRTGTIRNANTLTGTITLAVPSGATLDGATNGTTALQPYQKARIIQTGATAYITDWIDRSPIVSKATISSAVASVDLAMPAGYASFEMQIGGLRVDTAGVTLSARFSTDGGATILSASSSYYNVVVYGLNNSSTAQFGYGAATGIEVASSLSNSFQGLTSQGLVYPGSSLLAPGMAFKSSYVDSANNLFGKDYAGRYTVGPVTANVVRFSPSSGNISGGTIVFRGVAP